MRNGGKLGDQCQLVKSLKNCPTSTLSQANGISPSLVQGLQPNAASLISSETTNTVFGGDEQPLCPKPRRLGPSIPEFLKPLRCSKHSQLNTDGRSGVLNMIAEKTGDGRESVACTGCSPSCYSGSPPGRTGNPLVHDVHFIHQMELLSPFTRTKLSDKFGITSASPV